MCEKYRVCSQKAVCPCCKNSKAKENRARNGSSVRELSWKNHVDSIALKISKTIGLLSKLRHFVPHHTLVNIYNSLIAPYLRYGLTVCGQASKTYLNKLLILQKGELCFIYFSDRRDHAMPLFLNQGLYPFSGTNFQAFSRTYF